MNKKRLFKNSWGKNGEKGIHQKKRHKQVINMWKKFLMSLVLRNLRKWDANHEIVFSKRQISED